MSKITWLLTTSIAVITLGAGTYYYSTRTEVLHQDNEAAQSAAALPNKPPAPSPPKPDHGDFQRRFEPKPPPPNGGKLN